MGDTALNEVRVTSWGELHEELFKDSWQDYLQRHRSHFAFRGLSDAAYDLKTSLMRLGGNYETLEVPLLRNFKKYAQSNAAQNDSVWNWLSVAQHHGLPTRLLDWTYSPYVALHFATANLERFNVDGVVWCVDYVNAKDYLPKDLQAVLAEGRSNSFTVEMLAEAGITLDSLAKKLTAPFPVFMEPPSLDGRIINQFALFSLMSDPTVLVNEWLLNHPYLFRRIIIPASLKWEIRDKLDQANITERVLFPGLDGLSQWLTRYYTPRA
jgi:hypothetical protein